MNREATHPSMLQAGPAPSSKPSGTDAPHAAIPDAPSAGAPEGVTPWKAPSRRFFLEPQLFLVPLVLVTALVAVMVLIYVFFAAAAEENRSIGKLIQDLEAQGVLDRQTPHRAAHALALKAMEIESRGVKLGEEETRRLIEVLKGARTNPAIHRYVVLALGRVGREEQAVPLLLEVLADPQSSEGARLEAIRGLGLSRAASAVAPLLLELERWRKTEDWELRAGVLQALTNCFTGSASGAGREPVLAALRSSLADPHPVVSRNAAMWLADVFQDPSGVAILRGLLDRQALEAEGLAPADQALLMGRSIECLARISDDESLPAIRRLSTDNWNYKVKNAALRALERGSLAEPPSRPADPQ